ncbi:MAG: alpha/beta fold hydrolase, partial [Casimicrobium sp.]
MIAKKQMQRNRVRLRGHEVEYASWGSIDAPIVVMLHGWMDVGASFQFLVDAMKRDWHIVAPDQRGYGGTEWTR